MKYSKAYIFLKTKVGKKEEIFKRIEELKLIFHGLYRVFGTFDIIIELLYKDWQDLDDFMYSLQTDQVFKECITDEMRLISHDKNIEIEK